MQDLGSNQMMFSNGVNLQPSYFNGGNVDLAWALMKSHPKIKTVRIEIEPGQNINGQRWIAEAKAHGYSVIATYHKFDALLSDDPEELLAAGQWWKDNYRMLGGAFTVNMMNEWGSHSVSATALASAYNPAIALVREVYNGPIIIDCPGGGQETSVLATAVTGVNGERINESNIILSAHFYPDSYNGAKGRSSQIDDLDGLEAVGKPCIIGEFGGMKTTKEQANLSAIVDHAKSKGWPVLGWAWNGDGGEMNMISPQFQPFKVGEPQKYIVSAYFDNVYSKL